MIFGFAKISFAQSDDNVNAKIQLLDGISCNPSENIFFKVIPLAPYNTGTIINVTITNVEPSQAGPAIPGNTLDEFGLTAQGLIAYKVIGKYTVQYPDLNEEEVSFQSVLRLENYQILLNSVTTVYTSTTETKPITVTNPILGIAYEWYTYDYAAEGTATSVNNGVPVYQEGPIYTGETYYAPYNNGNKLYVRGISENGCITEQVIAYKQLVAVPPPPPVSNNNLLMPTFVKANEWVIVGIYDRIDGTISINQDLSGVELGDDIEYYQLSPFAIKFKIANPNLVPSLKFQVVLNGVTSNHEVEIHPSYDSEILTPKHLYSAIGRFGVNRIPLKVDNSNVSNKIQLFKFIYSREGLLTKIEKVREYSLANNGLNSLIVEHDVLAKTQYLFNSGGNGKAVFQSGFFEYKNPITYDQNYQYICSTVPGTDITFQLSSTTPFKAYSQVLNNNISLLRTGSGYTGPTNIPVSFSGTDTGLDPTDLNTVSTGLTATFEPLELFNSNVNITDLLSGTLVLPDDRSIPIYYEATYVAELVPLEIIVLERNSCGRPTKLTTNTRSIVSWTFNGQPIGKAAIISVPKGQTGMISALNSISATGETLHPCFDSNMPELEIEEPRELVIKPTCNKPNAFAVFDPNDPSNQIPLKFNIFKKFEGTDVFVQIESIESDYYSVEHLGDGEYEVSFDFEGTCHSYNFNVLGKKDYIEKTLNLNGLVFVPKRLNISKVRFKNSKINFRSAPKVYFLTKDQEYVDPTTSLRQLPNEEKYHGTVQSISETEVTPNETPAIGELMFYYCNIKVEHPALFTSDCQMWQGLVLFNSTFCTEMPNGVELQPIEENTYSQFSNSVKFMSTYPVLDLISVRKFSPQVHIGNVWFKNNYVSLNLQDSYRPHSSFASLETPSTPPITELPIDSYIIVKPSPGDGDGCGDELYNNLFDCISEEMLFPFAPRDVNGTYQKFISETAILSKLPSYPQFISKSCYPLVSYSTFLSDDRVGFHHNIIRNHLMGVITEDRNRLTQYVKGSENRFEDISKVGIYCEPVVGDQDNYVFTNLLNGQIITLTTDLLENEEYSYQTQNYPLQTRVGDVSSIEDDKQYGVLNLGREIGLLNHTISCNSTTCLNNIESIGFKGNIMSNEPSGSALAESIIFKNLEGITGSTFRNLSKGIVLTNRTYDNENPVNNSANTIYAQLRVRIKENTFENVGTGITNEPEALAVYALPTGSTYYWQLRCNEFKAPTNGLSSVGIKIKPLSLILNIGYVFRNGAGSIISEDLSGNLWPVATGTVRNFLPSLGPELFSPNDIDFGWNLHPLFTPIISERTLPRLIYNSFFNEFISKSDLALQQNVNIAVSNRRAYSIANENIPSDALAVCGFSGSTGIVFPIFGQIVQNNGIGQNSAINAAQIAFSPEISVENKTKQEKLNWKLVSLQGALLRSGTINGENKISFSLGEGLNTGMYILTIWNDTEFTSKPITIKQ